MLDSKIELLAQVPLFKGLADESLNAIAESGTKKYFEAGEKLIAEGKAGDAAYVIMTGKAGYTRIEGDQTFEEDLWPGTLVGELAMLVETVHGVNVVAKERLRALALQREAFRKTMEANPVIAQHISEILLVRLQTLAVDLRKVDDFLARAEEEEEQPQKQESGEEAAA